TRHRGRSAKNSNILARLMRLRITTAPAPSTPCTWNTDFAISRPIVLTSPMDGSPQCGLLRQNPPMALLMPQSGRRPQHQKQPFENLSGIFARDHKRKIDRCELNIPSGQKRICKLRDILEDKSVYRAKLASL